jgi:hypothetical protein
MVWISAIAGMTSFEQAASNHREKRREVIVAPPK